MAVTIIRTSAEDRKKQRIAEHLKDGQLPVELYRGGGLFDILHEPVDGSPCKPIEIGDKVWCMEDDHLFPVAAQPETQDHGLPEATQP